MVDRACADTVRPDPATHSLRRDARQGAADRSAGRDAGRGGYGARQHGRDLREHRGRIVRAHLWFRLHVVQRFRGCDLLLSSALKTSDRRPLRNNVDLDRLAMGRRHRPLVQRLREPHQHHARSQHARDEPRQSTPWRLEEPRFVHRDMRGHYQCIPYEWTLGCGCVNGNSHLIPPYKARRGPY